jgi:hypothetical protein
LGIVAPEIASSIAAGTIRRIRRQRRTEFGMFCALKKLRQSRVA